MQLVEPVNLLPPSICFICEGSPDGEAVVDTLYNFKSGVVSVLNGRKYVCERCVGEFAKLFGLESGQQVQAAQWERDVAKRETATLKQRVQEFARALSVVTEQPGLVDDGTQAKYEDVFKPSALDEVQQASASRLSQIQSSGTPAEPARRKKVARAPVPFPGLEVDEGAATDAVATAIVERVAEESNEVSADTASTGSTGPDTPEATEAAATLAEEKGVDLSTVEGTGADGRIKVSDVEAVVEKEPDGSAGSES